MIRIILDGLGGEALPGAAILAIPKFLRDHTEAEVLFVADAQAHETLRSELEGTEAAARLTHLEANEKIEFAESPVKALRQKKSASIRIATSALRSGKGDTLVSFGHTGATVAAAQLYLGRIKGVSRAGLAAIMPQKRGGVGLLMDVGANLKCNAEHLLQYAHMAQSYCRIALKINNPSVGLLNIGEEKGKGDRVLNQAGELLEKHGQHFIGNVEGHQIFDGSVNVVICNGITGNTVLKACEGLASMVFDSLQKHLDDKAPELLNTLAHEHHADSRGASRLLGVKGTVMIGHGNAGEAAVYNALRNALREYGPGLQADLEKTLSATSQDRP